MKPVNLMSATCKIPPSVVPVWRRTPRSVLKRLSAQTGGMLQTDSVVGGFVLVENKMVYFQMSRLYLFNLFNV